MEKNYYVCTGCGMLCDDIEVEAEKNIVNKVYTACRVGVAHMKEGRDSAVFRVDDKPVDEATAIGEAAAILKNAKNPLIFGLGTSSNEAQKLAIEIAKKTSATLDDPSSFLLGSVVEALLQNRFKTCTLDDVRNKADVTIFWGTNPSDSHPRHLSKHSYFPRGKEKQRGWEEERTAIAIDVRKSHTAKICGNYFFEIPPGGDAEFIDALIAALSGKLPKTSYNFPPKRILELANILKGAKFGVVFAGLGLVYSLENLEPLFRLMDALNEKANFHLIPMVGHSNTRGFNENLFEETGHVNSVKFEDGAVKHGPEFSIVESLKAKTPDAALIIGSDPLSSLPRSIVKNLLEIPVISLNPCETLTSRNAKVYINTAISGVESGGTATRMDGVKVDFKPVVETKRLSDEAVLKKIMEAL
ncbi:Formylmethanofuran dehydrogenase subunit B [Methanosarcina siciliae C2J]|uniref:Formylmethanofuran dehydrogenase subunit B n=3 Tax=Methanosarcina siciliae TaxID=38027 RepID=A0A0E3PFP5_9EURY|nr:formylmethanofuran dehydrogenase subunit B [Methanosarcina siciliae]AKB29286.1 Formylmethanofuran dehydrogenase subunit B [Methanosarcina siciliae T4/M]AKB33213.1 Formylmethanofuran dehydrogenase subunit B [Methanosarcina siciliae HI350]AKB37458.1 Formylmethanofuran dehydrogenase subunit B [Methanosarcina siciliae C2J]